MLVTFGFAKNVMVSAGSAVSDRLSSLVFWQLERGGSPRSRLPRADRTRAKAIPILALATSWLDVAKSVEHLLV